MLDKAKIIVLGVGNLLFQDEGIGVHVVKTLSDILSQVDNLSRDYPGLEIIDGGTSPEIASLIEDADKLVIVDAVKGGGEPGTIYRFTIDDVDMDSLRGAEERPLPKEASFEAYYPMLSLHQMHLIDNLRMLNLVGKPPQNVIIIGVEPKTMELGLELSPEIRSKIPEVIRLVKNEIQQDISSPLTRED